MLSVGYQENKIKENKITEVSCLLDTWCSTLLLSNDDKECIFMKGYVVEEGYMGYVNGAYMLFADEEDYREYFCDMN